MTTKITDKNISNLANIGVQWQSVFVGDGSTGLTAVAGRGYFIDTTSGAVTVTLPASPSAGDVVVLKDYARTWATNNVTTASALLDGASSVTETFSTNGQTVTLIYMDNTKGWSLINEDTTSALGALFVAATGGTVTTSGDYKIHTFTGDGCFVVSCGGNPAGSATADYLVVAGGGGGGLGTACLGGGGGGGAGGFRESSGGASGCYTKSPLGACVSGITVTATTYPITVGSGGAGSSTSTLRGTQGSNSVFSTITSTGGGGGGSAFCGSLQQQPGGSGGSGGGAGSNYPTPGATAGSGNTPPTSPPQGNNGGGPNTSGGWGYGGGGATSVGATPGGPPAGAGGNGATTCISTSPTTYAGGGGGGTYCGNCGPAGAGGPGGGGAGGKGAGGTNGTANTGGGGGGGGRLSPGIPRAGGAGGKGIVIIRYKYQ